MKQFYRLLVNTLIANVTTGFLWFALTFWVYLETKNVMATALLGGSYMLMMALTGMWFGTLVDKHKKKQIMVWGSFVTTTSYVLAAAVFLLVPHELLRTFGNPWFWVFSTIILAGCVVENIRNIALSTCVSIMVEEEERAKANGMVGAVQGASFMLTSIFSGLAVGYLGMGWVMAISVGLTVATLLDLSFVHIHEDHIKHDPSVVKHVDFKGAWIAIRAVPGLLGLVLFSTINNLIGGVYMALLDPYGLSLVSVQMWGIVYALSSVGYIIGGVVVSKYGLGKNPLKILLLINLSLAAVGFFIGIRESIWLLLGVMIVYMSLMPAAEAAEQTTMQKVVPVAKQGRVFGFSRSAAAAAAPLASYVIGPLAQYLVIPYIASPAGKQAWGWLLGEGNARGIAFIFMISAVCMALLVTGAFRSRSYHNLSLAYENEG